jgi:2-polyprenyl-3-methyl-5-hydroxy-6-metoxy-1,4-benzoquinol methylase
MTHTVPAPSVRSAPARRCYLCGSAGEGLHAGLRDLLFGVPGIWGLLRCSGCGLVWLDPRPERGEIAKLYERYHTHAPLPISDGDEHSVRRAVREAALRQACGYGSPGGAKRRRGRHLLSEYLGRFGPLRELAAGSVMWLDASRKGRLLDVGCGSGAFLAHMRDLGWEVQGLEPDPAAADVAKTRYGLEVVCAPLEEANIAPESFDVVTLSHVIEHVHDPVALLRECGRVLRGDGIMVMVTPNNRSWGSRWFGSSWRGWEVPRHLFVFSTRSLKMCAERAGLQVLELRTTARSARGIWLESGLSGSPPAPAGWGRERLQALPFWFFEHLATRAAPVGEEILMVARP